MLADQAYGGHSSLHHDAMAVKLGFRAGPIEGPTHFSLFAPLLSHVWGQAWFERGCLSAHYLNMVIEGEATRAFVDIPTADATSTRAWAEKADGMPVLEASASPRPRPRPDPAGRSPCRVARARAPGDPGRPPRGTEGAEDEIVRMEPDQHMGALYPFSLAQKLAAAITETSPWYSDPALTPWGKAIIPLEMVSVLAQYSSGKARFPVKGPAVGLFADQEIRMVDGPLFVGEDYLVRREIAALSESRRTESYWARTRIYDVSGKTLKAEMLLNHASLKDSYAGYADGPRKGMTRRARAAGTSTAEGRRCGRGTPEGVERGDGRPIQPHQGAGLPERGSPIQPIRRIV